MVLSVSSPATIPIDRRAIVDGLTQVHVATGPFAGSWIVLADGKLE